MGDTIFILLLPPTPRGLLFMYVRWLEWGNSKGTQCRIAFHLFLWSYIKLMLVFQVVLCKNHIPGSPMLHPFPASV